MQTKPLALALLATVASAFAQTNQEPPRLQSARESYERAIETARKAYAAELGALQRQLTQQGNLDMAQQVQAELKRLLGPTAAATANAEGPNADPVVFDNHRYEVILTPASRSRAESDCRKRGGTLACADSAEELTFLHETMQKTFNCYFWIDAKFGPKGAQFVDKKGRLIYKSPSEEKLPYICEWAQ